MLACALTLSLVVAGRAAADEILFLNGDRLSGKIVSADGGKLTIKSETAGEVTVDLAKVKTFSTTRLRHPERRRKMYAISSASAGRSDRWHPYSEDAR
jgi:hypothetical protein